MHNVVFADIDVACDVGAPCPCYDELTFPLFDNQSVSVNKIITIILRNSTKRSTVKNRHRFVVHFVLTTETFNFKEKAIFSYHNQIVKVKWLFRQNYKDSLTISILVSNLFSIFYCLNSLYLNPYIATKTPTITGTKLFSNKTVTLIDSCTYGKQDFLIYRKQ